MLITAIQPIIAMHYCGNELNSLHVYHTNGIQDFCCDETENHDLLISGDFCCETEMMKLTTDEFQNKTEQLVTRITPVPIDILGFTLTNQITSYEPETDSSITSLKFPPKGLYLEDVSILTYICIYRI